MGKYSETKTYVTEYIKALINMMTDENGKVEAKKLIETIDDAFPKGVIYEESENK